jgi:hypothetical protein
MHRGSTAIGLAKAAGLTGKNVSTIHRAMEAGRLFYTLALLTGLRVSWWWRWFR